MAGPPMPHSRSSDAQEAAGAHPHPFPLFTTATRRWGRGAVGGQMHFAHVHMLTQNLPSEPMRTTRAMTDFCRRKAASFVLGLDASSDAFTCVHVSMISRPVLAVASSMGARSSRPFRMEKSRTSLAGGGRPQAQGKGWVSRQGWRCQLSFGGEGVPWCVWGGGEERVYRQPHPSLAMLTTARTPQCLGTESPGQPG